MAGIAERDEVPVAVPTTIGDTTNVMDVQLLGRSAEGTEEVRPPRLSTEAVGDTDARSASPSSQK